MSGDLSFFPVKSLFSRLKCPLSPPLSQYYHIRSRHDPELPLIQTPSHVKQDCNLLAVLGKQGLAVQRECGWCSSRAGL